MKTSDAAKLVGEHGGVAGPTQEQDAVSHGLRLVAGESGDADGRFDVNTFRQLADLLLLPASMFHPHERAFAIDTLQFALPSLSPLLRRQLAQRLSGLHDAAPGLVSRLIRDPDIEVAEPLLRSETSGSYRDIRDILYSQCPERSMIIASRPVVDSEIAAQIVTNSERSVVLALLENRGARLSSAVVSALAERARREPELCEALVVRPEMYPSCALDLYWNVERNLRLYIVGRFLEDASMIRRIVRSGVSGSWILAGAPDMAAVPGSATPEDGTDQPGEAVERLVEAHCEGDVDAAAAALAASTHVGEDTARRIVMDRGGDPLAVALKAANVSRKTFAEICGRWNEAGVAPFDTADHVEEISVMFDRLSRGGSKMALTYWDWREMGRGPFESPAVVQNVAVA